MSTTFSVHIEAPVEKVFDFWKDPRNWPRMAAESPVEVIQAHVPPEGVGTFHVATFALPGVRMEYFGVFTEFVPNERIVDKVSLAFEGTWTYTFAAEGSGTRLTMRGEPRSFWRLWPFDRLVDRMERLGFERYVPRLRELLEERGARAKAVG